MDLDAKVLEEEFKNNSPNDLYRKYLLGNNVWYFKNYLNLEDFSGIYDDFKKYIADRFDVSFNDVAIVGSAKTGFSLSHNKDFKLFDSDSNKPSDIDLVLISNHYFNVFWKAYHKKLNNKHLHGYSIVASSILRKFITFTGFDEYEDNEYADWLKQIGEFQREVSLKFDIEHKLNYRIFESWQAAELYYKNSIKRIKTKICKTKETKNEHSR